MFGAWRRLDNRPLLLLEGNSFSCIGNHLGLPLLRDILYWSWKMHCSRQLAYPVLAGYIAS
jgi:hypothetical protein